MSDKIDSFCFLTSVIKEQNYRLLKLIEKQENLKENELIDSFFKMNYYSPIYTKNINNQEDIEKKLLLKKIKKLSKKKNI